MAAITDIELVAYFVTFILGLIFSMLTIFQANEEEKNPLAVVVSVIAGIIWTTMGLLHTALLYDTAFLALSYLFYGLSTFLFVWAIALIFLMIRDSVKSKKDEPLTLQ